MSGVITLATFNVKDLFDPLHTSKLREIAAQLLAAQPSAVALQEIGNEDALRGVLAFTAEAGLPFSHATVGTPDKRGIRNAILARVPVAHARIHERDALPFPVFVEGDPEPFAERIPLRRAIVEVQLAAHEGLGPITLFSAHFKSKRPAALKAKDGRELQATAPLDKVNAQVRSLVLRVAEGLFVRSLVDTALAATALVAVMGDLNDTIDAQPVRAVCGDGPDALVSATQHLSSAESVSCRHGSKASQIDHILISPALALALVQARVFNHALRDHGPMVPSAPPTIDSDHALVSASFASARTSV